MNLLYSTSTILPNRKAHSIQIANMCNALANAFDEVILSAPVKKDATLAEITTYYDIAPEVTIRPWRCTLFDRHGLFNALYMCLETVGFNPDVFFTREVRTAIVATLLGYEVVLETHQLNKKNSFPHRHAFDWMLSRRNFLACFAISKKLRDALMEGHEENRSKFYVLPDGADKNTADPKGGLTKEEVFSVGYVGHLYRGRGMAIIERLVSRFPQVTFHIVGGEPSNISLWKSRIGHHRNVKFHGFVPPAEVASYLRTFDVLIAPYQKELETAGGGNTVRWMSPLKIFEYMAAGKPIIASDLPVLREVLIHGDNALLCEPKEVDCWSSGLNRIMNDPEFARQLGENAQERFEANYTWKQRAEKIKYILKQRMSC